MKMLYKQITELKSKIEPLQESPDFSKLSGELKNKMVKWDKEVQDKKKNKYIRDSGNYSRGEVFKWQSKVHISESVPSHIPTQVTSNKPLPGTTVIYSQPHNSQGAIPRGHTHSNNRGRARGDKERGN